MYWLVGFDYRLDCFGGKSKNLKCTHKSEQKKFGKTELKKTAEQSEDVENNCVFSSFFGTFFLLWLANKEEKKDRIYHFITKPTGLLRAKSSRNDKDLFVF